MYSVLLTTVMSLNTATPDFGWFRRGGDCYGCAGCAGCHGGIFGFRSRFRDRGCHGCAGCYGGPTSYAAAACYGAPMASFGAYPATPAPAACCAGYGSYGVPPAAGVGEAVGPYGVPHAALPGAGLAEAIGPPGAPGVPTPPPPLAAGLSESIASTDSAAVVVQLPADAELTVEGQRIDLTGPVRVFRTPKLEPGKKYVYKVAIAVVRGGMRRENAQNTEPFQAGQVVRVDFVEPPASAASGTSARIRVRLPGGAALVVEGQPVTLPAGTDVFRTPSLEPGRTYHYTLTAAVFRDGRIQTVRREVAFRAGQEVAVDLTEVPVGQLAKQ